MESYLVDEQVLGDIVDALLKEKYPGEDIKAHASDREQAIKNLDHQILKSVVGSLTYEQGVELNDLLTENNSDPAIFEGFFKKHNIDLQKAITDTMVNFKKEFLEGGQNE